MEYFAHLEVLADTAYVSQGTFVGTRGQARRLEGFGIRVVGPEAYKYDVFYAAHLEGLGDTAEYKNGEFCGTRGQFRRVEAIKVRLVRKICWFCLFPKTSIKIKYTRISFIIYSNFLDKISNYDQKFY